MLLWRACVQTSSTLRCGCRVTWHYTAAGFLGTLAMASMTSLVWHQAASDSFYHQLAPGRHYHLLIHFQLQHYVERHQMQQLLQVFAEATKKHSVTADSVMHSTHPSTKVMRCASCTCSLCVVVTSSVVMQPFMHAAMLTYSNREVQQVLPSHLSTTVTGASASTVEEVQALLEVVWAGALQPLVMGLAGASVRFDALPSHLAIRALALAAIGMLAAKLVLNPQSCVNSPNLYQHWLSAAIVLYTQPQTKTVVFYRYRCNLAAITAHLCCATMLFQGTLQLCLV